MTSARPGRRRRRPGPPRPSRAGCSRRRWSAGRRGRSRQPAQGRMASSADRWLGQSRGPSRHARPARPARSARRGRPGRAVTVSRPPGTSTTYDEPGPRRRRAGRCATIAAHAPVPQDRVSPTPRSCTRIATCRSPRRDHELDVHPVRVTAARPPARCAARPRRARSSTKTTACGLPVSTSTAGQPGRRPSTLRSVPGSRAGPMSTVTSPSAPEPHGLHAVPGQHVELAGLLQPLVDQEAGEHPDAVAAHLGDRPVGVAVVHEPRRRPRRAAPAPRRRRGAHDPQHAVATDAGPPVAERAGRGRRQGELAVGVGQQHEVVLGAVALDEADHATRLRVAEFDHGACCLERRASGLQAAAKRGAVLLG